MSDASREVQGKSIMGDVSVTYNCASNHSKHNDVIQQFIFHQDFVGQKFVQTLAQ